MQLGKFLEVLLALLGGLLLLLAGAVVAWHGIGEGVGLELERVVVGGAPVSHLELDGVGLYHGGVGEPVHERVLRLAGLELVPLVEHGLWRQGSCRGHLGHGCREQGQELVVAQALVFLEVQ